MLYRSPFTQQSGAARIIMAGLVTLGLWLAPTADANPLAKRVAESGSQSHWLSYQVDSVPDLGFACCLDRELFHRKGGKGLARPGRCRPDDVNQSWSTWSNGEISSFDPTAEDRFRILLRVQDGRVDRVRAYSSGCEIEFQNPVVELQVTPKDSLDLLAQLARDSAHATHEDKIGMVHAALGFHRHRDAGQILVDLAEQKEASTAARRSAIFWLGQTRGAFAVVELRRLLENENKRHLREHIIFSLSQTSTPDNQGTTELIRLIKESKSSEIRRQALFWLGSSKDPRALDLLANVLR